MTKLMQGLIPLGNYMDGLFVIIPSKKNVDSEFVPKSTEITNDSKLGLTTDKGGYLKSSDYVVIKKREQTFMKYSKVADTLIKKIKKYVPNPEVWK